MPTIIDPPSGWKYGFPREMPEGLTDLRAWLVQVGYPESMIDLALNHSQYWEKEETDRDHT